MMESFSVLFFFLFKVLYAQDTDQRSVTFEKAIEMAALYEERARMMILRSAILKGKVMVKTESMNAQGIEPEGGGYAS